MKRNIISLLALASASTAFVLPAFAENGQNMPIEVIGEEPPIPLKFHNAVSQQVLEHINPKMPLPDRFSRVMRPRPMQYYSAEIISSGEGDMVDFRLVHFDRSVQDKQNGKTVVTTGQYNSKTGEVFLMESVTGELVPAARHSLIRKRENT